MPAKEFKLLAAALVAGMAVSACSSNDENDGGTTSPPPPPPPSGNSGASNPVLFGLSDEQDLVRIQLSNSTTGAPVKLTGAMADNPTSPPAPQGLDVNPADGSLYVYFSDGRFYTANTATGALTLIGRAAFPFPGFIDSIDFNPVANVIRALSDQSEAGSYRVSASNGSLLATDTSLSYVAGDPNTGRTPGIEGVAYTGAGGATVTTTYVIDTTQDVLARLGGVDGAPSPNSGQLTTIGALGAAIGGGGAVGFDIPTGQATTGFVSDGATGTPGNNTEIYSVNLGTGVLTRLMTVTGRRLVGIAVVPGTGQ